MCSEKEESVILKAGMEEAKHLYKEVKLEAKKVVRNAKNEEREQLGEDL